MATNPIKNKDISIVDNSVLKPLIDQLAQLKKELVSVNTELAKVGGGKAKDNVRTYTEAVKKSDEITNKMVDTTRKINEARSAEAKKLQVLTEQLKSANSEKMKEAKVNASLNSSLEKMRATLNRNVQMREKLNLSIKAHRVEFERLTREINKQEAQLKKYDAQIGRSKRNVGNYASAFRGLGAAIGINLGIYGIFSVLRNAIGVLSGFEKQMSRVKAISGATADDFAKLKRNAEQLGASTLFTATEIAKLQEELAKLGFSTREILNTTEAASDLAIIAGGDLARAAEVSGVTLRGFGLDASEAGRVVDIMALSFTSSALDMEKFAESMKYVAPIAKAAGISIEETTALLSKMADAGISGSMAGTSLREIISQLDKTGKTTGQAIADLAEKGLSLASAEDEVGKRAKTALLVLAENVKETDKLTIAYNNATGAAREMATEIADNLAGDVTLLSSAWDGFIMSLNKGDGEISKALRKVIQLTKGAVDLFRMAALGPVDYAVEQGLKALDEYNKDLESASNKRLSVIHDEINASNDAKKTKKEQLDIEIKRSEINRNELTRITALILENERLGGEWTENNERLKVQHEELVKKVKIDTLVIKGIKALTKTQVENNKATKEGNELKKDEIDLMDTQNGILPKIQDEIKNLTHIQNQLTNPNEIRKLQKLIDAYKALEENISNGGLDALKDVIVPKIATPKLSGEVDDSKLIFPALNIDEDDIEAINQSFVEINTILTDIVGAGLAERRRLIDEEVSRTESEVSRLTSILETERDKQAQGLANQTSEIEAQLNAQQAARDKAVAQQEEVAKKQGQIAKSNLLINQTLAVSNLLVASAEIFKGATPFFPAGVPLAIASIGTMFAFFKTLTTKASEFTKFEEGGTFIEGGQRHSQGGNKYSNGVETEIGERIAVFSRPATKKHDGLIQDFTNAVNDDRVSDLFRLNFQNKMMPANVIGINYGALLAVSKESLLVQKETKDYIRRTKIIQGNTTIDLNGNRVTRI